MRIGVVSSVSVNSSQLQLQSSLQQLARRWWMWRALEAFGIAILIAAVVGLGIVPFFAWRGESSWSVAAILFGAAILISAIFALRNKPTELQTAIHADHQWKLDDLLATAISFINPKHAAVVDPAMRQIITNLAADQLHSRRASELVFSRFGSRMWSTIGLSTALLISLTAICSHPLVLQASTDARNNRESTAQSTITGPLDLQAQRGSARKTPQQAAHRRSINQDRSENAETRTSDSVSSNQTLAKQSSDGAGNSSGDSATVPAAQRTSASQKNDPSGTALSGGQSHASRNSISGNSNGQVVQSPSRQAVNPPWTSDRWEDQKSKVLESLNNDPPPATYRDLIRDYFSR